MVALFAMGCAPVDSMDFDEMEETDLDDRAVSSADYQAESATGKSGCSVATDKSGFTGSGFIDYGSNGTWIEWNNVKVSAAGSYSLTVRYANASTGNRPLAVIVNGAKIGEVACAATGSWKVWKTASIKAALRNGSNTIRLVASTAAGGPNVDKMHVIGGESSSSGSGMVSDLEFVQFASLPRNRQRTTFTNVTANYVVYDESHGRDGHNDIRSDQPGFVGMSGATLVGYGGGRDKYLALFKVTSTTVVIDLDQGQEDDDGGAAHALFIKTKRALSVAEARSMDPAVKAEDVPGPRASNEIVIYAEDEGGKGDRDAQFISRAYKHYGSGDDKLYVFTKALGDTPNGNGAIMRLSIR